MFNRRSFNLEDEYKKSLDEITQCENLYDYYQELRWFITLLNDPHSYVTFPDSIL